jgi:hypothetical protein
MRVEVFLHRDRRRFDRPSSSRRAGVLRVAVGVEDAAAGADDRAAALVVEGGAGHVGGRALRAVAGEQEDRFGQPLAEALHRLRLGGADDGADRAISARADQTLTLASGFKPSASISLHVRPSASFASWNWAEPGLLVRTRTNSPCPRPSRPS